MKTLIIKTVDDIEIITGFDRKMIDGVATNKKVTSKIAKLLEYQNVMKASNKYINALNKKSDPERIKKLIEDMNAAKKIFDDKLNEIRASLVVYFGAKANQKEVSEEEFQEYVKLKEDAKSGKMLVTLDKKLIPNLKGAIYYLEKNGEPEEHTIKKIGVALPKNAKLKLSKEGSDIIDRKREQKTVDSMTPDSKEKLFDTQKNRLIDQASTRVTELEIGGMSGVDAKEKAFAEYQEKLTTLKSKHKKS